VTVMRKLSTRAVIHLPRKLSRARRMLTHTAPKHGQPMPPARQHPSIGYHCPSIALARVRDFFRVSGAYLASEPGLARVCARTFMGIVEISGPMAITGPAPAYALPSSAPR
jgi:hypothetical protein